MNGMRLTPLVGMVLLAAAALALYAVKYRVQDVRDEVSALSAQLEAEREALALLQAEWAFLNRPERLERLSARYLDLQVPQPQQFVAWEDLPATPVQLAAER